MGTSAGMCSGSSPALISLITSSLAGSFAKSAGRRAYPSRGARGNSGMSRSASKCSASTRFADASRSRTSISGAGICAAWDSTACRASSKLRVVEPAVADMWRSYDRVENDFFIPRDEAMSTRGLSREFLPQPSWIAGEGKSGFKIDHAVAHQPGNLTIEVLHAFGAAAFDRVEQAFVLALAFFNALTRLCICLENFECGHAPAAIRLRDEPLADHVTERLGKALTNRLLFRGRERTHDAFNRLRRIHCVEA